MAISFVGSLPAVGANNGGNVTLSFSNLRDAANGTVTLLEGDLVIIGHALSNTSDIAMAMMSSNWEPIEQAYSNGTTYDTNIAGWYKFMGPSPDSSAVLDGAGGNSFGTIGAAMVFRGVDPADPFSFAPANSSGTGTTRPDPASVTPDTAGSWPVVIGAGSAATGTTLFTVPSGLSSTTNHFRSGNHAETNDIAIGMGFKTDWSSGAFDCPAFGGGNVNAANSWAAIAFALKPAPEVATCAPVDSFQGQAADVPSVTPAIATAANDAAQAQTIDQPTVAPVFVVAVNDAAQAQGTDAPALTAIAASAPADVVQGQQADQPAIAPGVGTAAADLAQGQTADMPTVTFAIAAAPGDLAQVQRADAPSLVPAGTSAPQDALQGQSAGQSAITAVAAAVPSDTAQAQVMDAPTVATGGAVAADDTEQGQSADAASAVPAAALVPAVLAQAQKEDVATIAAVAIAFPDDAAQAQGEDSPTTGGPGASAAEPDDIAQGIAADQPSVAAKALAAANDARQLQAIAYRNRTATPPSRGAWPRRERRTAAGPRRVSRRAG